MFRATQQWVTKERGPGQRKCPWAIPELWLQMGNRWVHRPFPTCFQDMRPNQERTCLLAWESEFEQTPGVDDGQGSLACCSPLGCKASDTTERLNWTDWKSLAKVPMPMNRVVPSLSLEEKTADTSVPAEVAPPHGYCVDAVFIICPVSFERILNLKTN